MVALQIYFRLQIPFVDHPLSLDTLLSASLVEISSASKKKIRSWASSLPVKLIFQTEIRAQKTIFLKFKGGITIIVKFSTEISTPAT